MKSTARSDCATKADAGMGEKSTVRSDCATRRMRGWDEEHSQEWLCHRGSYQFMVAERNFNPMQKYPFGRGSQ
jgi:hypothetical protein